MPTLTFQSLFEVPQPPLVEWKNAGWQPLPGPEIPATAEWTDQILRERSGTADAGVGVRAEQPATAGADDDEARGRRARRLAQQCCTLPLCFGSNG